MRRVICLAVVVMLEKSLVYTLKSGNDSGKTTLRNLNITYGD